MVRQLGFIQVILEELEQSKYLYASDILYQLYRQKTDLSTNDLMVFFRQRNQLIIWETIMDLCDLGYIRPSAKTNHYEITLDGIAKMQMILACLNLGRVSELNSSSYIQF
jgi:hypothetical protein